MSDGYSSALAKRPSNQKPGSSRRDDDDDRYGGSRGGESSRARDRGEDDDRNQRSLTSRGGSTRERRFIPCTIRTIPNGAERFLCAIFKVSVEKIQDWCDDEYIRIDTAIDPRRDPIFLNIDPLREVVSKKDWERYEKEVRTTRNEWEAQEHMARLGIRTGRPRSDFEGGEDEDDEDDWDD